jgi:type I restriction enzyme S subunit
MSVSLSDVATINPSTKLGNADLAAGVSFLPMAAVDTDGRYEFQTRPLADVSTGYTIFAEGDVLLAKITPCFENGKATFLKSVPTQVGFGSTEFHVVRPGPEIDGRYLYRLLTTDVFRREGARNMTGSAGQKRVPADFLKRYKIPLPPLPEQRRIAAILDHADALRAKRRAAIAKLDSLAQSIFLDMFGDPVANPKGWPISRLGEVFSKTRAGTRCGPFGSSLKKEDYLESGIPVLGIDDVLPNLFIQRTTLFISEQKYNQLRSFDVIQGDILISRAGTVGRLCVVDKPVGASIIGTNLIRLSLDEGAICPEYFAALFTFFAHRFTGLRANAKADAYSFMSTGVLKSLEIPVPDVSTQRLFVDQQRRIKESSVKLEQHYSRLTELTQQLSIRAFQGTL